jgi:hypothetical protein
LIERYQPYTIEDIPNSSLDTTFVLLSEAEIKKEKAKWRLKLTENEKTAPVLASMLSLCFLFFLFILFIELSVSFLTPSSLFA